jgi:capsid protein
MGVYQDLKNVLGFSQAPLIPRVDALAQYGDNPTSRETARRLAGPGHSADDIQTIHKNYLNGQGGILDVYSSWGGDKYMGQFGVTKDLDTLDLYTLRMRSRQLYRENAIVSSLFRRMETKILTTGLQLEANPIPEILVDGVGISEDELIDWSMRTESLYKVYMQNPSLIDYRGIDTLAEIQKKLWRASCIDGDALVIVRYRNGNPNVQIIAGSNLANPENAMELNVRHGTRYGENGEEIGYFVRSRALKSRTSTYSDGLHELIYIPRRTTRGRLNAWRFVSPYGLIGDDVPAPLLSVILSNLKETDRYIDNEQRAKALSASLVWFMEREKPTLAMTGLSDGAAAYQEYYNNLQNTEANSVREDNNFKWAESAPGMSMSFLQPGEKPHIFETNGRDSSQFIDFVTFNMDLMSASLNLPPEMLLMKYGKNFSASRQVKIDFASYREVETQRIASMFNNPIYEQWLLSQVFQNKIEAQGYFEAWKSRVENWDIYGAWNSAEWQGQIEDSIEPGKFVASVRDMIDLDMVDGSTAARKYFGTNIEKNIRRNKKLAAMRSEGVLAVEGEGDLEEAATALSNALAKNALQSTEKRIDLEHGE